MQLTESSKFSYYTSTGIPTDGLRAIVHGWANPNQVSEIACKKNNMYNTLHVTSLKMIVSSYMYTELKITAGPRPFSVQFSTMATQKFDYDRIKLYRWPIKISVWPAKPEVLFSALCTRTSYIVAYKHILVYRSTLYIYGSRETASCSFSIPLFSPEF